jgi:hypothetical protein
MDFYKFYFMLVWRWFIYSLTIEYTWKFLLDNGYNFSFEKFIDNETYDVKSCFVLHVGSNAKQSKIKNYISCIVHITFNCVQNLILVIMYNGLSPIFVSLSIGI